VFAPAGLAPWCKNNAKLDDKKEGGKSTEATKKGKGGESQNKTQELKTGEEKGLAQYLGETHPGFSSRGGGQT